MGDDELAEIRARRMAQLQQQRGAMGGAPGGPPGVQVAIVSVRGFKPILCFISFAGRWSGCGKASGGKTCGHGGYEKRNFVSGFVSGGQGKM